MIYSNSVHLMERGLIPFTEKGTTSTPIPAPELYTYRVSTPPGQSGHRFYWRHSKPNNEAMIKMIYEPDPGPTDNNHQIVSTRRNRDMKIEVSTKQYSYFNQSMYYSPQPKSGRFTRSPIVVNIR
jgi:hypothetical protein